MADGHRLDEGVPLRESRLWRLQAQYFQRHGEQAWSSGAVPAFPTSNAAIAAASARVMAAWAEDTGQPLQIVELGAGHGRFGIRCTRHLSEMGCPYTYTLTDGALSNIAAMQRHPFLQPALASGHIRVMHHDAVMGMTMPDGPIVLVAHYCFDGLLTDVFRVQDGVLEEGRVILTSDVPITDDPDIIDELDVVFDFHPVEPEGYYGDPELDRILGGYRHRLKEGTFCFPIGTLRGLQAVLDGGAPVLLLAADKGHIHLEDLENNDTVGFASHGSFSLMVNFDAVAQLFVGRGGSFHGHATHDGPLEGGGFLSAGISAPRTQQALRQHMVTFGPSDFYVLYQAFEDRETIDLDTFLAILRLSHFDPQVYVALYEKALDEISDVAMDAQHQLLAVVEKVWAEAFPIGGDPDVSFALGRTLHQMGRHELSLTHYVRSLEISGDHPATRYNMGLCQYWLGDSDAAQRELGQALVLDATYSSAQKWLDKIRRETSGR